MSSNADRSGYEKFIKDLSNATRDAATPNALAINNLLRPQEKVSKHRNEPFSTGATVMGFSKKMSAGTASTLKKAMRIRRRENIEARKKLEV